MSSSRERQSERTSSAQSFLRRNNDHLNKQRETSNHSQSENNSRTPRSDPKQYHTHPSTSVDSRCSRSRSPKRHHSKSREPKRHHSRSRSLERRHSKSRSPERRHSRSRSPKRRHTKSRSPERRHSRSRSPERRHSRSRSPGRRHSRGRQPDRLYSRSRSPGLRSPPGRKIPEYLQVSFRKKEFRKTPRSSAVTSELRDRFKPYQASKFLFKIMRKQN